MSFARKQRRKAARAMVNSKMGKEGAEALAKLCITGEAADRMVAKTIAQERLAIQDETIGNFLAFSMWTLHLKFGFGQKRLKRFYDELNETADCISGRYIKASEIKDALKKECGVVCF